ncbi:MAG: hypothetical protein IJK23_09685 [Clostridia bacterium]|nr:hypothetical protein [Clostridia bacterium]
MSKNWTPEDLQAASEAMHEAGEMSYDEFTEEVNAANSAREKIDAFAKIQTDGTALCPRCGMLTVKEQIHTNALSRHASVYICDACGMDEAIRDWTGNPLPLKEWAINKQ